MLEKKDALTVTQVNTLVHDVFAATDIFSGIAVRGEISNLVKHRSGHFYFSLKDEGSQLRALMFRTEASRLPFSPENGMNVIMYGTLGSYVKDGSYRFVAYRMEPDGIGALHMAFEQLKRKLASEGLFDAERKKAIPKIPSAVGIVTSPTGAAVRDLIHVLGRRFPFAKTVLFPALVQGDGAAESLIKGIDVFEERNDVDVIIIGRGGGSAEDLWAFNDEKLARRIATAHIPIISAVGHETDFTICDFVADLRAPTPSAAAELAVPEITVLKRQFGNVLDKMYSLCAGQTERYRKALLSLQTRRVMTDPEASFRYAKQELSYRKDSLVRSFEGLLKTYRMRFEKGASSLDALSPLHTLSRGYSVASKNGELLKSTKDIAVGEAFSLRLQDGTICATRTEEGETDHG